jgi:hypothetical protein
MAHAARDHRGIAVMPGLDGENIPVAGWTCPIAVV